MRKILLTFGCSWTYGVGVWYTPGMTYDEYDNTRFNQELSKSLADEYSFRGLLSKKYDFENINFSEVGSSNLKQFMLLKRFFTSDKFKNLVKENAKIVVLHGITSTARAYFFDNNTQQPTDIMFNTLATNKDFAIKNYFMNFYNHDHEVAMLTEEIQFINQWYDAVNIKHLWFDTFNSHNYTTNLDNFVNGEHEYNVRDLLSSMAILNGMKDMDKKYHQSTWRADTNRAEFLIKTGHLNPLSIHPTKMGHQLIADLIGKDLEKII